jgi:hypothetical protein
LCEHIACDARGEKRCCAQTQGEKFSLQWNVGVQKIAMKAGSKRALLTRFIFGTKKKWKQKIMECCVRSLKFRTCSPKQVHCVAAL